MFVVSTRAQKALEHLPMKLSETIRSAKTFLLFIMLHQEDTKIIVPYVRGKIVADNSLNTTIGLSIDNTCFQYFNQRQRSAFLDFCLNRNNIDLNGITVTFRIIPVRQGVEAIINHRQDIAQIFLATFASRQVGKVGSKACTVGRAVVFVETSDLDIESKLFTHRSLASRCMKKSLSLSHLLSVNFLGSLYAFYHWMYLMPYHS